MITAAIPLLPDELLTDAQKRAIEAALHWLTQTNNSTLTIGGRAGTGKTTIVRKLLHSIKNKRVAVVAPTGKATAQLRKKGITLAQTVHGLIYVPDGKDPAGGLKFKRHPTIDYDLVIVDEASTVNRMMHEDLLSYGVRVIYLGDHWQLEPIEDKFNLMEAPEIVLGEIHRQAANSPIIRFAEALHYNSDSFIRREVPGLEVASRNRFWQVLPEVDMALVGFNKTRHKVNQLYREMKGFTGHYPQEGEKVICLKNNRERGVYNGMTATVLKVQRETDQGHYLDIQDETGRTWESLPTLVRQYGVDSLADEENKEYLLFDFGYALTTHKAQGSEYPKVAVLEEIAPSWSPERWRYTSATRAMERLVYCI